MSAQPALADLPTVKVSTRFELDAGPARQGVGPKLIHQAAR